MAVHDWSTIGFGNHSSKNDRATLTHQHDVGYDLATVLMVRARDGAPIAPVDVSLKTGEGLLSTRPKGTVACSPHVDQILPAMRLVRDLKLETPVVHVIDREADSVNHWRQWSRDGHLALVRADDRKVLHEGEPTTLKEIAVKLRRRQAFKDGGMVDYRGRKACRDVAETEVVLHRPGKRNEGGKKVNVPGPPLPLRLIVVELRNPKGRLLAQWLLLTNVPKEMGDAMTIALWYYFRWRIEKLHKILKSAGWQLEEWLQRKASRFFIKLLVALGALASIWSLERRRDAESLQFQHLLMHLSGRQTKRHRRVTTTGLLAGLWVLQASLGTLSHHGPKSLNNMLSKHLPIFANEPTPP